MCLCYTGFERDSKLLFCGKSHNFKSEETLELALKEMALKVNLKAGIHNTNFALNFPPMYSLDRSMLVAESQSQVSFPRKLQSV